MAQALQERFGGIGDAAGAKAAAVAASAVVLAGGGAAGVDALHHDAPRVAPAAFAPAAAERGSRDTAAMTTPIAAPDPSTAWIDAVATAAPSPGSSDPPAAPDPKPAPDPGPEFDPGTAPGSTPAPSTPHVSAPSRSTPAASVPSADAGGSEFGP
jgi:hypothetical protein